MLAKLDLVEDLLVLVVTSPLLVGMLPECLEVMSPVLVVMPLVSLEVKLPVLEVTLLELTFLVEWLVPYLELERVGFLSLDLHLELTCGLLLEWVHLVLELRQAVALTLRVNETKIHNRRWR
ncbi:hypothetical protein PR001_g16417 [Phytophthora rubi]|uniref:Uncharacterized protein n=1 Tax=Phytophthora rubi TaxID=129364 RepID=A0A6A3KM65_9STRA|nr:hypothetical protein PR002_g16947 [Phytophthora rubi]KAE9009526.1 hypothetical protein PR001_g16417 [Phytophthora rubi]